MSAKPIVDLQWIRYGNFFDLYEGKANVPKLIYVIGESRLVYVGCVGVRDGKKGLASRYQKPYVERAKSIFGLDEPKDQPAFVGEFMKPRDPDGPTILNAERIIQKVFDDKHGLGAGMFKRKGKIDPMKLISHGDYPSFLAEEIDL